MLGVPQQNDQIPAKKIAQGVNSIAKAMLPRDIKKKLHLWTRCMIWIWTHNLMNTNQCLQFRHRDLHLFLLRIGSTDEWTVKLVKWQLDVLQTWNLQNIQGKEHSFGLSRTNSVHMWTTWSSVLLYLNMFRFMS